MRVLLDTCTVLWLTGESPQTRVPASLLSHLASSGVELFVSAISDWEIATKHQLGKLDLPLPAREFMNAARRDLNAKALPFQPEDVMHLHKLPLIHRDPFDRMLICQAIQNGLSICTPDPHITQYPISITWNSF